MKKMVLATTASLLACIGASHAANVVISNVIQGPGDTLFVTSNNIRMNSGVVTLGYFAAGFDVNANLSSANWGNLVTNFTVLASGTPGSPSLSLEGSFPGYIENAEVSTAPITGASPLLGRMMYGFVGGSATLAESIGLSGGGIALFEIRPIADDFPFVNTYVSDPTGKVIKIGSTGTFVGDAGAGFGNYSTLRLTPVPEPSVALLGALAMLGFLRRRR